MISALRPKFIFAATVGLAYLTAATSIHAYSFATKTDFPSVVAAEDHLERNRSIENDYAARTRDIEQQFAERYAERSVVDRRAERLSAREAAQQWQATEDGVLIETTPVERPAAPVQEEVVEVEQEVTMEEEWVEPVAVEEPEEELHAGAPLIEHGYAPPPFLPSSGFGVELLAAGIAGVALQRTRARRQA